MFNLVEASYRQGQQILEHRLMRERKQHGQFLTPPPLARFMARQIVQTAPGPRLLDPAIGSGVLAAALIEALIEQRKSGSFILTGYEVDAELLSSAEEMLEPAIRVAAEHGVQVKPDLREEDFIAGMATRRWGDLWQRPEDDLAFDAIIANPPYFKLASDAPGVRMVRQHLPGHTNIYTLFMALAIDLLARDGTAVFIVPRSFCSGAYSGGLRRFIMAQVVPTAFHLFDSRTAAFQQDAVLQENVIVQFARPAPGPILPSTVEISSSAGLEDLDSARRLNITLADLLGEQDERQPFFRLPLTLLDLQVLRSLDGWPQRMEDSGLQISTGPLVPFRSPNLQTTVDKVLQHQAVPLLWMQHVQPGEVCWPLADFHKPEGLLLDAESSLLVRNENLVLLRRFSPKEAARRLVAAPWLASDWPYAQVGIENHLNYIYRRSTPLTVAEARGLAAYLNSGLIDRYFRLLNGHTQVNAGEVRRLPMPSLAVLAAIGEQMNGRNSEVDALVTAALVAADYLPDDFPLIQETRI